MFVLDTCWSILKLFWFLGLFPCKKVTNFDGSIELQASRSYFYFLRYFLIFILCVAIPVFTNSIVLSSQTGVSPFAFTLNILSEINPSATDYIAYTFGVLLICFLHGILNVQNWIMRYDLVKLQEILRGYNVEKSQVVKKFDIKFGLSFLVLLASLGMLGTGAGITLFMFDLYPSLQQKFMLGKILPRSYHILKFCWVSSTWYFTRPHM